MKPLTFVQPLFTPSLMDCSNSIRHFVDSDLIPGDDVLLDGSGWEGEGGPGGRCSHQMKSEIWLSPPHSGAGPVLRGLQQQHLPPVCRHLSPGLFPGHHTQRGGCGPQGHRAASTAPPGHQAGPDAATPGSDRQVSNWLFLLNAQIDRLVTGYSSSELR